MAAVERYSACGEPRLEERVARDVARCCEAVRETLPAPAVLAVVLSGGYGRGEGGVRWVDGVPLPYNDYDLYVVTPRFPRPVRRVLRLRLERLAEALTVELGVEVEFAVLDGAEIAHPPATMAMADLWAAHRVLWGPADILTRNGGPTAGDVPPVEASRLLLNRSALLVMAAELLGGAGGPASTERVTRYVRKAWLAAGDSALVASDAWNSSPTARREALARRLDLPADLRAAYDRAAGERLEGKATGGDGAEPTLGCVRDAARALVGAVERVERARLGVGPSRRGRYLPAALAAEPARLVDRLRDLRDHRGVALGGWPDGTRSARLLTMLPDVLELLAGVRAHAQVGEVGARALFCAADDPLPTIFLDRWRRLP